MTNLSVAALLYSSRQHRDECVGRDLLPVCFDQPMFVANPDTHVPAAFKCAIERASALRCHSYTLEIAVQNSLQSLDTDVQGQVTFSIGEKQYGLAVGTVGYLGADIRVIFFSTHYLYGNPIRCTDEARAWNAARDGTELQPNELVVMMMASQHTLQNAPTAPKEVSHSWSGLSVQWLM